MNKMKTFETGEVFSLSDQIQTEPGKAIKKVVIDGKEMKMLLVVIEKGELPEHPAPLDALVTVIEGEGTLAYEGKAPVTIRKGDSFAFKKGALHSVRAENVLKFSLLLWKED